MCQWEVIHYPHSISDCDSCGKPESAVYEIEFNNYVYEDWDLKQVCEKCIHKYVCDNHWLKRNW